jgi:hypothetical protein
MHEHDILQGFFILDLDEEGILVTGLLLKLDHMSVNMVYVLIFELLVELPLELSAVLFLLEFLLLQGFLGVQYLGFHVEEGLFLHREVELALNVLDLYARKVLNA